MTQIARLYGGSLYNLAAEEQLTEVIQMQMTQIRNLFREYPDYLHLLKEPSISLKERQELIEDAFGSQTERYVVNFLKLLCEHDLLREYAGCCEEFTRRYNEEHGIVEAVVTSAVPLSETQMTALKEKLEKMSGKHISLVQKIDSSVIAGLLVEMEGKLMDGTVRGRLSGISKNLKEIIV